MTGDLTIEQYNARLEQLWEIYGPKMKALTEETAATLRDAGYVGVECFDNSDEEYGWSAWWEHPNDDGINLDLNFQFVEEKVRGGDEDPVGVTFALSVAFNGGFILAQISPFNFSDDWVVDMRDDDVVQARWEEFVGAICDWADYHMVTDLKDIEVHPLKECDDK